MFGHRRFCLLTLLVSLTCTAVARQSQAQSVQDIEAYLPRFRTDHMKVVQSFGLRYFGAALLPGSRNLLFPMAGGRYWVHPLLAVEAGAGIAFAINNVNTWNDFGTTVGFPIRVAEGRHINALVRPFASLFHINNQATVQAGLDASAELQFGFIGLPQLALQASIGVKATFNDHYLLIDSTIGPRYTFLNILATTLSITYYFAPG